LHQTWSRYSGAQSRGAATLPALRIHDVINKPLVPFVAIEPAAMSNPIPFNRVSTVGREVEYVTQALLSGHVAGDGAFTAKCSKLLEERLGAPKVLLTTSCTHALEMAALLLDLGPGDEVIVPSFTFVSTLNAFILRGALPVFIDIRPDTLNLNETLLERLITQRTRAILVV